MKCGDIITVRAYPDAILERLVWEDHPTWIMVCRPEVYLETIGKKMPEPTMWMGFPKEDVVTHPTHLNR